MNYEIRPLRLQDLKNGFFDTLYNLCDEEIDLIKGIDWYESLQVRDDYFVYVAVISDKVVGTACLQLDRKFIHNCGIAGRIEDVATRTGYEGQGIARNIMDRLIEVAQQQKCYKIILSCNETLQEFYEKFGFFPNGLEMKLYFTNSMEKEF